MHKSNGELVKITKGRIKMIAAVLIMTLLVVVPFFAGDYVIQITVFAFIMAYLCGAWNIASGYGGLLSFGHAAFIGIGGYTTAVLLVYYHIPGWIGMFLGGILAALLALLLTWSICRFRIRGFYFAVSTILVAETIGLVVVRTKYLGRGMGITFPAVNNPFNFQFIGVSPYYYLALILLCGMIFLTSRIERSKLGWYLRATRQGEEAAAALGVNVTKVKVVSMTLSGFLTGVGGGFYVLALRYCSPYDVFGLMFSVTLMLGTLLGGRGTVLGPVIGIFMLTTVKEVLTFAAGAIGGISSYALVLVFWGIILCFVAKYLSDGLFPWIQHLLDEKVFVQNKKAALVLKQESDSKYVVKM